MRRLSRSHSVVALVLSCAWLSIPACQSGNKSATEAVATPLAAAPAVTTSAATGRECSVSSDCSWWQDPDPTLLCCAGQCTNTASDPENCGACGGACGAGQECRAGKCGATGAQPVKGAAGSAVAALHKDCSAVKCGAGQICCGGVCVNPAYDARHCGRCNVSCRAVGAGCYLGACCPAERPGAPCHAANCPDGTVACPSGCVDIGGDPDNCGACGRSCPGGARSCVSGTCQP
jgi:hypothetical protein